MLLLYGEHQAKAICSSIECISAPHSPLCTVCISHLCILFCSYFWINDFTNPMRKEMMVFFLSLSPFSSFVLLHSLSLSFSNFYQSEEKKNPKKWKSRKRKESTWKLACKGIWDHLMCSCLAKIIKMWFYLWNSTLCSIGLAFASCIVHFKHSWSPYITMIAFGSAWVRYVCRYSFRSVGNSHWMIFSCFFFAEEIILLEKKLQVQNI